MKKNNIRRYETLQDGSFPQIHPNGKTGGETCQRDDLEGITTHNPKETLDRVWTWLGDPDVK